MPIYVLKSHTPAQFRQFLSTLGKVEPERVSQPESLNDAISEAEKAVRQVRSGTEDGVELSPQGAYIRRLQHLVAERSKLASHSLGQEPHRRVRISRE